jgi:adenine-specific DNA-methyltransferase
MSDKSRYQIFTPEYIVKQILDKVGFNGLNCLKKYIIDHSCGSGNFLVEIVKRIVAHSEPSELQQNLSYVYGFDIDIERIDETKGRLNEIITPYNIEVNWNIFEQDALKVKDQYVNFFDFVVGNPPYIRASNIEDEYRDFLKKNYSFCRKGNTDIYMAFYQLSFEIAKQDAKVCMITPNSFLFNVSAKDMRDHLASKKQLVDIINFGSKKIFENADTYTAIAYFEMDKTDSKFTYYLENDQIEVDLNQFKDQKMWILKNGEGDKLKNHVNISVGIATLCDKAYIFSKVEDISEKTCMVNTKYRGNILIETALLQPILKISKVKEDFLLLPYEMVNGKYKLLEEEVLRTTYPLAYKYLLSIKEEYLDKRDKGAGNKVGWYAFGRSQGMVSIGKKLIFSGMNDKPNFQIHDKSTFVYSGYYLTIKEGSDYTYEEMADLLNSEEMREFVEYSAGDFSGGFKSYKKSIIENFHI